MGIEDRFMLTQPGPYEGFDLIDAQSFGSLLMEYARSSITAGGALSALNSWVSTPLTASEETDLGNIRALIDAELTENAKVLEASRVKDILILGEKPTDGYMTRAELKTKLGF